VVGLGASRSVFTRRRGVRSRAPYPRAFLEQIFWCEGQGGGSVAAVRARTKRRLVWAGLVSVAFLLALNSAVRAAGGAPSLLSPFYVPEKLGALARLTWHVVRHPLSRCDGEVPRLLTRTAQRHKISPALVRAVADTESGLEPHRISSAGAMGVMQLMPGTAAELGVTDPFDPRQNIEGGVRYLALLAQRYRGDRSRLLAAYNAGPGAVRRTGAVELPDETRAYVRRVAATARGANARVAD
jgi:soluble lytic murein transglycosylase-like protein